MQIAFSEVTLILRSYGGSAKQKLNGPPSEDHVSASSASPQKIALFLTAKISKKKFFLRKEKSKKRCANLRFFDQVF